MPSSMASFLLADRYTFQGPGVGCVAELDYLKRKCLEGEALRQGGGSQYKTWV